MVRQRCDHPLVPKVGEPKGARSCKVRLEPRPEGEVPDTGQILRDRIDLTLECIRRHCEGADDTLAQFDFEHEATPTTTSTYITYRESTLDFIARRGNRMADWVEEHHPLVTVHR